MERGASAGIRAQSEPFYSVAAVSRLLELDVMAVDLEAELNGLYQLSPGDFVAARDALARRLREDGAREHAEEVKRLRKPTVAVWIVNRLAHERELDVQRLAKAGEALMQGQAGDFQQARREEQQALSRLTQAAQEIAQREKVGATAVNRASKTIRAAALSDEHRDLLRGGRITEELEPPGLEALAALARSAPPQNAGPSHTERKTEGSRALPEARARVRELRAEERELAATTRALLQEAKRAEKEASQLRTRANEAEADLAELRAHVSAIEEEVARLQGER